MKKSSSGAPRLCPPPYASQDVRVLVAVAAWLLLLVVVLARSYRAFLLTLVGVALIPTIWGWSSYTVSSGSMEPTLSVGDVVVGKPFDAATSPPPIGAVMVFTRPASAEPDEIFMHRVVKALGDEYERHRRRREPRARRRPRGHHGLHSAGIHLHSPGSGSR